MVNYQIYIGPYEQHIVVASNEKAAVNKWLNQNGYDSPEAACAEYEDEGETLVLRAEEL